MYRFTGFFVLLASCVLILPPVYADNSAPLTIETPKPLPPMRFTDVRHGTHMVDSTKAKLTAVHFWATWCAPCIGELPQIDVVARTYADKGLNVISLSLDGSHVDKVRDFYVAHNITTLKPFFDNSMDAFNLTGSHGLPTTIFLDARGNEIARSEGPLDWNGKAVTQFIETWLK